MLFVLVALAVFTGEAQAEDWTDQQLAIRGAESGSDIEAKVNEVVELVGESSGVANGNAAVYDVVPPDSKLPKILTPSLKKQTITKLRLPNGLGIYIVSDEQLETSAMGVGVEVGSWSDPDDALGMAHFVEHMMFMGTKQHPKPGNFDEFLAANGAQISNAATGSSSTCYAFSTPHDAFKAGISRFSEFFTDPLFATAGAAKEMHAVNQEFEMHKDEDGYREYMVSKQLANPEHPDSRFSIGNLDTLSKVDNAKLVDWHSRMYSANLMHVAVYTALPVEDVKQLIVDKFSNVPNHQFRRLTVAIPTMREDLIQKVVHTKPERDVKSLGLSWELSPFFAHKRTSSPDRLVSYILGDEGPGSLAARLRENHLALSVSAGMSKVGRDNAVFSIDLSLTEKGMRNRDAVVGMVFKVMNGVKSAFDTDGVPKYIWEEARQRDINDFKLQERTGDTFGSAMGEVRSMFNEPLETYPRTQTILQHYDPVGARDIIDALTPEKMAMTQMGGVFPPPNMVGEVQTETFYKAKFAIEAIKPEVIKTWTAVMNGEQDDDTDQFWGGAYAIPPPNTYLLQDPAPLIGDINCEAPKFPELPEPKLTVNGTFGKLYVGVDKNFGDPYISASIQIKTAGTLMETLGPKARLMTQLFTDCLSEAVKAKLYPFEVAGLSASVSMGKGTNLYVSVGGKVPVKATYMAVLETVLKPMKEAFSEYASEDLFDMVKKAIARYYKNKLKSGARATAGRVLWNTFSNTRTPVDEKLGILNNITYAEVEAFIPQLMSSVNMEGFIYGRITEAEALEVYNKVKGLFVSEDSTITPLAEADEFVSKMRVLPSDQGPWYKTASGSARSNATILMIDGGHMSCEDAMALPVLYKEVGNLFFRELRTKQQTGYVASSYATTVARRSVVLMLVESSWAGPGDLLKRFEAFNEMVLAGVNNGTIMPEDKLDSIRGSMLSSFNKPIQNIGSMSGILESIIKEYDGDFEAELKRKLILGNLTRATIVRVANAVLGPQNKRRFSVLYSPDGAAEDPLRPPEYSLFDDSTTTSTFVRKPKYHCDLCDGGSCSESSAPSDAPSEAPTAAPTAAGDSNDTSEAPTTAPTAADTDAPTAAATDAPTAAADATTTKAPTAAAATKAPTAAATKAPTAAAATTAPTTAAPTAATAVETRLSMAQADSQTLLEIGEALQQVKDDAGEAPFDTLDAL